MQSLNNIGNKKAVLGGMMTTFIATVVIVAILVIFILLSGSVRSFSNIQSGTRIDKEYPNLQYIVSYDNLVLLRDLTSSSAEFKFKTFGEVIDSLAGDWEESVGGAVDGIDLFKNKASVLSIYDLSYSYVCCEYDGDCESVDFMGVGTVCNFVEGFPVLKFRFLPYSVDMDLQSHLAKGLNKK